MTHCENCHGKPAKDHRDAFGSRELCEKCHKEYQNMRAKNARESLSDGKEWHMYDKSGNYDDLPPIPKGLTSDGILNGAYMVHGELDPFREWRDKKFGKNR